MNESVNKPADYQARQSALDTGRSFIVKAPAGSGKTTLLVKRYLCLLTTVKHPEEILAMTFTRKAASEMTERVVTSLARAESGQVSEDDDMELLDIARRALDHDRHYVWRLIDNPARIRIQTIDSLSQRLVRQMPWSAGFGAAPTAVADDTGRIYLEAARQCLLFALDSETHRQHARHLLLALDNNFNRACNLLVNMLASRDQWQVLLVESLDDPAVRHRLQENWRDAANTYLQAVDEKMRIPWRDVLLDGIHYAAANLAGNQPQPDICQLTDLSRLPPISLDSIEHWKIVSSFVLTKDRKGIRKSVDKRNGFPAKDDGGNVELKQAFMGLLAELNEADLGASLADLLTFPDTDYSEEEWQLLVSLVEVLKLASQELILAFQSQGSCDHIEIAARANQALGDPAHPTDLALSLDYKIQHLLVDEFQDTSHTQMEMIRRLTGGWQVDEGRTVFFVGDPMQSIYRFRKADVGIFLDIFANGLPSLEIHTLELTENFRSSAKLVEWINHSFENVFPYQDNPQTAAVKYTRSIAYKTAANSRDGVSVHAVGKDSEAGFVVDTIRKLLAGKTEDETIAVLVRGRKHLLQVIAGLKQAGIDFQGLKLEALLKRSEIQDILALTRALLHHGDKLSWLAVLRAPWCGLPLADLTRIARQAQDQSVWNTIKGSPALPAGDSGQRLQRLVAALATAVQRAGKVPLHHVVAQAWQALGGPDTVPDDNHGNIKLYLQLLATHQQAGSIVDMQAFEQAMDDLWAGSGHEGHTLQLMTMHNAKGLEFDYVLLPGLYKQTGSNKKKLLIWHENLTEEGSRALLVSPINTDDDENTRYEFIGRLERKADVEESRRLLYVACTRAKKQLHLYAKANPPASTLQCMIQPFLQDEIERQSAGEPAIAHEPEAQDEKHYSRLPSGYIPARLPENLLAPGVQEWQRPVVAYQWAGVSARHIGTLIHEIICSIAGGRFIDDKNNHQAWQRWLFSQGVDESRVKQALVMIDSAITAMREDKRAQWILSPAHRQAKNEWALGCHLEGKLENAIIDRTFIDEQGRRWIIDYKTSTHEGGKIEDFLNEQENRYRHQLETYAAIIRLADAAPISLGLYFPLLREWRDWEYDG